MVTSIISLCNAFLIHKGSLWYLPGELKRTSARIISPQSVFFLITLPKHWAHCLMVSNSRNSFLSLTCLCSTMYLILSRSTSSWEFCTGNPIIITHLPQCYSKSIPSAIFPLAMARKMAPLPISQALRYLVNCSAASSGSLLSTKIYLLSIIQSINFSSAHYFSTCSMYLYDGKKQRIPSGTTSQRLRSRLAKFLVTALLLLLTYSEEMGVLSVVLAMIIGWMEFLVSSISMDFRVTGLKFSNFGYSSRGLMVPEVRMTEGKFLKTGAIAMEASVQAIVNAGSIKFSLTWLGSNTILNPLVVDASRLSASDITSSGLKKFISDISNALVKYLSFSLDRSKNSSLILTFEQMISAIIFLGSVNVTTFSWSFLVKYLMMISRQSRKMSELRMLGGMILFLSTAMASVLSLVVYSRASFIFDMTTRHCSLKLLMLVSWTDQILYRKKCMQLYAPRRTPLFILTVQAQMQISSMLCASSNTTIESLLSFLMMSPDILASIRYKQLNTTISAFSNPSLAVQQGHRMCSPPKVRRSCMVNTALLSSAFNLLGFSLQFQQNTQRDYSSSMFPFILARTHQLVLFLHYSSTFSLDFQTSTCLWMQRFFLAVSPVASSFLHCGSSSSTFFNSFLSSLRVFSISTTVLVQYTIFLYLFLCEIQATKRDSKHTVLPVPVGISKRPWPWASRVLFSEVMYSTCQLNTS